MLRWKEDGLPTIYKASSLVSWQRHVGKVIAPSVAVIGLAAIYTGDIFIFSMDLEHGLMEKIVTHEVGHILAGPWHSSDPKSVMYRMISKPQNMTIQLVDVELAKRFCKFFE